ncbi:MAG: tetratricopeptide repeat protein [Salinivirgaceae bacterium]|nr:tetratricopeptide repeat protein [Salinivirgaceae bacterium]
MRRFTKVSILTVLLVMPIMAMPQSDSCHNLILNFRFDDARHQISRMPEGHQTAWLSAYTLFVEQLSRLGKPQPDAFAELLKTARHHQSNSADYQQCLSDIYLMKCYACFVNGSYLSSYATYTQARQAVANLPPNDWRRQRFELIELIYDGQVQNVAPLFADNLTENVRTKRYCQIVESLTNNPEVPESFKNELKVASLLLYPLVSDNSLLGLGLLRSFGREWPVSSPIAAYTAAKRLIADDSTALALKILSSACQHGFNKQFNSINLLIGNTMLNISNDSCEFFLNQFISNQNNPSDVLYAKFKLAWFWFLKGDTTKYESLCQKVMQSAAITSSDAQAKYECAMYRYWDTLLLRARLAFDAADYKRCKSILEAAGQHKSQFTPIQANEYAYRMGRVCHKTGDYENAKRFYEAAIDRNLEKTLYYPCYAAYYIGLIYKSEGDKMKANEYFKICRKTDSPIYGESIHQKAKREME